MIKRITFLTYDVSAVSSQTGRYFFKNNPQETNIPYPTHFYLPCLFAQHIQRQKYLLYFFLYKYTTQIAYSDNRGYHISWSIEDIGLIFEYDIDGHMDRHP